MQLLTSVLAGITDVIEEEGRCLRASTLATARAVACIAFATIAASVGLVLFLYGVFLEGSRFFGDSVGAFVASAAALLIALAVAVNPRARARP